MAILTDCELPSVALLQTRPYLISDLPRIGKSIPDAASGGYVSLARVGVPYIGWFIL